MDTFLTLFILTAAYGLVMTALFIIFLRTRNNAVSSLQNSYNELLQEYVKLKENYDALDKRKEGFIQDLVARQTKIDELERLMRKQRDALLCITTHNDAIMERKPKESEKRYRYRLAMSLTDEIAEYLQITKDNASITIVRQ